MAADTNTVVLVGRLTADPELRDAGSAKVLSGRLAFTRREKKGEEWVDVSNFIDVTLAWNKSAEALHKYLSKGSRLAITGEIRWREWEAKDGTKRQTIDIHADQGGVQMLDTKAESEARQQAKPSGSDMPVDQPAQQKMDDDDSVPF